MNMQPVLSSDISSILGSNFNFTLKKMQKTSKQSISSKKLKSNSDLKNDEAEIYVFADKDPNKNITQMHQIIESKALPRNKSELLESKKQIIFFQGRDSAVWLFHQNGLNQDSNHSGLLNESLYANARDQFGQIYNQLKSQNIKSLKLKLFSCSDLILEGIIIGLELASYQFLNHFSADKKDLKKLMIQIELDSDQSLSMEQIQKIQIK